MIRNAPTSGAYVAAVFAVIQACLTIFPGRDPGVIVCREERGQNATRNPESKSLNPLNTIHPKPVVSICCEEL